MDWASHFRYENGFLIRLKTVKRYKAGSIAGLPCKGALYCRVRVNGVGHYVHKVVWEMHHGPLPPGMEIDHINRDGKDNRIENLRLATHGQNNVNRKPLSNNSSGVTGVVYDPGSKRRKRWIADIKPPGMKRIRIGRFLTFEEAVDARRKAEQVYHGEFSPVLLTV